MKKIYILLLCALSYGMTAANGTQPDSGRVIVGSQVQLTIPVLNNDDVARGYTLSAIYPTTGPFNISISGNNVLYNENGQGTTNNDTFYYVAKDASNVLDTNYVVIYKSDLTPDLFPGDANRDNICNNIDVLNIGIAYGKSQIAREGVYKSDNWTMKRAYDWTQFNAVSNYRFSDADGNGTVDSMTDVTVVLKNYNQTSNTANVTYSPTGGKTISILSSDTFKVVNTSNTFQLDLRLGNGTAADPVNSYGIAFSIKYDTTYFKANQIHFNPSKWYLDQHSTLNFARVNHPNGEMDLAIVRRDGGNGIGSGSMGIIEVVVEDILGGLTNGLNAAFEVHKAVLIDSFYNILPVTLAAPRTVYIHKSTSSIASASRTSLSISQDVQHIVVQSSDLKKSELKIYNILGREVFRSTDWATHTMNIDTKNWNSGIYIIQYQNEFYKIRIP